MTIIPAHPQTRAAFAHAQRLADLFCPVTVPQHAAHQQLVDAIYTGDLYRVVDAMHAARSVGRRGLATLDWREWSGNWLAKVDRLILNEQSEERAG